MDMASFFGPPREITLGGRSFVVSPLKLREWAEVQQWIKDSCPSPMAQLADPAFAALDAETRKELRMAAWQDQKAWPPRVASPAWFEAMSRDGGSAKFLHVVLSKHQPFTPDDAAALEEQLSPSDVLPLILVVLGLDSPKAGAPPSTGRDGGTTTDRRRSKAATTSARPRTRCSRGASPPSSSAR